MMLASVRKDYSSLAQSHPRDAQKVQSLEKYNFLNQNRHIVTTAGGIWKVHVIKMLMEKVMVH